ncbi:MAG: VPLPA-CTERM sorting domain-containing protein [Pseudomonadota bacterium]
MGSKVTGTITFDDALVDSFPGNSNTDSFESTNTANAGLLFTATFNSGSYSGSVDGSAGGSLTIRDDTTIDLFAFTVGQPNGGALQILQTNNFAPLNLVAPGPGSLMDDPTFNLANLLLSSTDFEVNIFRAFDPGATGDIRFALTSISAVPLPAAAWLFISALGGLFGIRKLKTKQLTPA